MTREEIGEETILIMTLVGDEVVTKSLRWAKGVALRSGIDNGPAATGAVILGDERPGAMIAFKISKEDDYSLTRLRAIYPSFHRASDADRVYEFGDLNEFFHFRLTWHPY